MKRLPDLRALRSALATGKAAAAIPVLERLTDWLPTYPTAYVLLARAYEMEGRTAEARNAWQRARFFVPGSPIVEEGLHRTAPTVPRPAASGATGASELDDLDRLIDDLESARIDPVPDPKDLPAPNLDDDLRGMVSETLARIYAAQEEYIEAARVYARLADQHPKRARDFWQKAAEVNECARS